MEKLFNENKMREIKYSSIEKEPKWFVQGSYVLDKIFNKNTASDIDIFIKKGDKEPVLDAGLKKHIVEMPEDAYFPPVFGSYNTDKYIMTENGIFFPDGFPQKPEELIFLLDERVLDIVDVLRGFKIRDKYDIRISENLDNTWTKTLVRDLDSSKIDKGLFDGLEDFIEYVEFVIGENISKENIIFVKNEIEKRVGKDFFKK